VALTDQTVVAGCESAMPIAAGTGFRASISERRRMVVSLMGRQARCGISPDAAFSVNWTAFGIFIVLIGGIGTLEGSIIGALEGDCRGAGAPWAWMDRKRNVAPMIPQ